MTPRILPSLLAVLGLMTSPSQESATMKRYREWNVGQTYLLPPAPSDWLPEGHLVYFILDVVKELDLRTITRVVDEADPRGERPYSPVMMVTLLLYAYCVGIFSSRRIERATHEDVAFRVLTAGQTPCFTRIAEFRRVHLEAFAAIFTQTVKLCQKAGLVKLGRVAVDGTRLQGNASKHKAMSYERMTADEKRIEEEIASLLARAEEADRSDDKRLGEGQPEEDLPAELRRREGRLEKIREAKRALEDEAALARAAELESRAHTHEQRASTHAGEAEGERAATRAASDRAQAQALRDGVHDDEPPPSGGVTDQGFETHHAKATADGTPHPKAQYNFTDPQSRLQRRDGTFLQGYNAQAAVDGEAQVIVAQGLTNLPVDTPHLQPLLEQTRATCGAMPDTSLGDSGYWSPENAQYGETSGTNLLLATARVRHGMPPDAPAGAEDEPTDARTRMRRKLSTPENRAHYSRRKAIVEPVFGQIKEVRGFRRFLLRGLKKVAGEWAMVTATHNLLKLFRHGARAVPA